MQIIEAQFPPAVEAGLKELDELFNSNAVLAALEKLGKEAAEAPLARRFDKERLAAVNLGGLPGGVNPYLRGATEERFKREQLGFNVASLKADFMSLLGNVRTVYLDLKASQLEFPEPEPAE